MKLRTAIVRTFTTVETVDKYLPPSYRAVAIPDLPDDDEIIVIVGWDHLGWTLDGYVIPRLASGLIFAEESE